MSEISKNYKTQNTVSVLSNPFSTGVGGVDFEYRVQSTGHIFIGIVSRRIFSFAESADNVCDFLSQKTGK